MAALVLARSTSYVMTKVGIRELGTFDLLAARLVVAFLLLLPLAWGRLRGATFRTLLRGAALGAAFTSIMALEVTGLETADASTAAFLVNGSIVLVPLFEAALHRALPKLSIVASAIVSLAGVALLTLREGRAAPSVGELICLGAAAVYACAIILTDRLSRRDDPLALGTVQVGTMAILSVAVALLHGGPTLPVRPATWGAVLWLAVICTCFGFTLQPLAQSGTTSERAGLLCALGPVGGALSGWAFLGEEMGLAKLLGMGLILLGMFLVRLWEEIVRKGCGSGGSREGQGPMGEHDPSAGTQRL